jgi:hypothetical protein
MLLNRYIIGHMIAGQVDDDMSSLEPTVRLMETEQTAQQVYYGTYDSCPCG